MESNQAIEAVNEELVKAYLAGMLDTSSTITVRVVKSDDHSIGFTVEPEVAISRKSPYGIQVMDDFCMNNGINCSIAERGNGRLELSISRPRDVAIFLEKVQPYLHDRSEEAAFIRNEIIPDLQENKHLGDREDFLEVVEKIDYLRTLNPRSKNPTYTEEYFRDEWDLEDE